MLGISREVRESRFYRDIKEETRDEILIEAVPMGLQAGLSLEEIAQRFKVSVEEVQAIVDRLNSQN